MHGAYLTSCLREALGTVDLSTDPSPQQGPGQCKREWGALGEAFSETLSALLLQGFTFSVDEDLKPLKFSCMHI